MLSSLQAFYGVYDGHGGRAAVDFVSDHLGKNVVAAVLATTTEEAQEAEPSSWSTDAVSAAIRAAYLATDSELVKQVCTFVFTRSLPAELNASTHADSSCCAMRVACRQCDVHYYSVRVCSLL